MRPAREGHEGSASAPHECLSTRAAPVENCTLKANTSQNPAHHSRRRLFKLLLYNSHPFIFCEHIATIQTIRAPIKQPRLLAPNATCAHAWSRGAIGRRAAITLQVPSSFHHQCRAYRRVVGHGQIHCPAPPASSPVSPPAQLLGTWKKDAETLESMSMLQTPRTAKNSSLALALGGTTTPWARSLLSCETVSLFAPLQFSAHALVPCALGWSSQSVQSTDESEIAFKPD